MPSSVYITLIFWSLLCLPCRACNQVPQRRIHQHWGLCRLGGFVTVRLFEKDYPLVGGPSFAPLHKAVVVSLEETAETSRETAETAQEGGRETDARSRVLQFDVIPLQPKEPVVLAKLLSGTTLKGEMRHRTFPRVPPGSRLLVERRIDIQPGISQLEERLQSAALLWDLSFNFYFRNCLHFCDYMLLQLLLICGDDSKLSRDKEGERAHGEIDERLGDGGAVRLEWSSRKLWPDRVMSLTWWRKFIWEGRLKGYRETRLDANVFVDREDGRGQGRKRKVRLGQLGVKVVREGGLRGEFLEESFQQSFPDEWQRKTAGVPPGGLRVAVLVCMKVEPEFRGQGLGGLLLRRLAETASGIMKEGGAGTREERGRCDGVVMVCDDDGSGRLIRWYEQFGFRRAPSIEDNAMLIPLDVLDESTKEKGGKG